MSFPGACRRSGVMGSYALVMSTSASRSSVAVVARSECGVQTQRPSFIAPARARELAGEVTNADARERTHRSGPPENQAARRDVASPHRHEARGGTSVAG